MPFKPNKLTRVPSEDNPDVESRRGRREEQAGGMWPWCTTLTLAGDAVEIKDPLNKDPQDSVFVAIDGNSITPQGIGSTRQRHDYLVDRYYGCIFPRACVATPAADPLS